MRSHANVTSLVHRVAADDEGTGDFLKFCHDTPATRVKREMQRLVTTFDHRALTCRIVESGDAGKRSRNGGSVSPERRRNERQK